jgi:Coenzyme PQQ synthesis protein D (PqqD)
MPADEPNQADSALTGTTVLRRNGDWMCAMVGEELVMMDATTGENIGLTATGARIWELLAAPLTLSALCEALAREYDAAATQIESEVAVFVRDLAARRIVLLEA